MLIITRKLNEDIILETKEGIVRIEVRKMGNSNIKLGLEFSNRDRHPFGDGPFRGEAWRAVNEDRLGQLYIDG